MKNLIEIRYLLIQIAQVVDFLIVVVCPAFSPDMSHFGNFMCPSHLPHLYIIQYTNINEPEIKHINIHKKEKTEKSTAFRHIIRKIWKIIFVKLEL